MQKENNDYYNYRGSKSFELRKTRLVLRSRFSLKDICAAYIIIWTLTPIISENSLFRALVVVASLVFLLSTVPIDKERRIRNYMIASICMLLTYLIINFIGQGTLPIAKIINLFVFVILGYISLHYHTYEDEKFVIYVKLIVLLFVIVCIPSLIALRSNMFVLRRASGVTVRHGIERYAGAYGFAYGCVFLVSLLVYDLHEHKKKGKVLIWQLGVIAILTYLIINSGYTTAVVLTVIGIVAALTISKNPIKTIIITGIAGVALVYYIPIILQYIIRNFDVPLVYQQKLVILTQVTDSSNSFAYSDTTRGGLLKMGLDSIVKYPVFGSVLLSGSTSSGGHQEIIDVLANYGVIYALLFYYVILGTPYRLSKEDKGVCLLYLTLVIALGLTDTFDFATMSVPLFLCPYIARKCYVT